MKFGNTGLNINKKIDSKSASKSSNLITNTAGVKEVNKKQTFEGLKKSFAKVDTNKPKNINSIAATSSKVNCKSTPEIKNNVNLIKLNEDNKYELKKEDCIDVKANEKKKPLFLITGNEKNIRETIQNNLTSSITKQSPKNGAVPRNSQLNLWKKPIAPVPITIGGGNSNINIPVVNGANNLLNENLKNSSQFSKIKYERNLNGINQINNKETNSKKSLTYGKQGMNINNIAYSSNNNISKANILSTNKTDKEENIENKSEILIPVKNYLVASQNSDNLKFNDTNKLLKGIIMNKSNNIDSVETKLKNIEFKANLNSNHNFQPTNNNYITNYNFGVTTENLHSEILSSILNFKTLLKTNDGNPDIEKLKSEKNIDEINQLNKNLNLFGGVAASKNTEYEQKDKSLLNDFNNIKRNTFIENSIKNNKKNNYFNNAKQEARPNLEKFNEFFGNNKDKEEKFQEMNINLISATMLSSHNSQKLFKNSGFLNRETDVITNTLERNVKDKIFSEIQTNAERRIKKYEILLDFINSNLKEINKLVSVNFDKIPPAKKKSTQESYMKKDDDYNSNMFSSLHSRINLNSRSHLTNILNEKENICDLEESEMIERSTLIFPRIKLKEGSILLNLDSLRKEESPLENRSPHEVCPSFFISSINSDYYQNLLEDSVMINLQHFNNLNNISIELGSVRTQNQTVRRLERMFSYDSDKTPLQYMNLFNSIMRNNDRIQNEYNNIASCRRSMPIGNLNSLISSQNIRKNEIVFNQSNNINKEEEFVSNHTAYLDYYEGEENLEESELDKTKENNKFFDFPLPVIDIINREQERSKFIAHKIPQKILHPSMDAGNKQEEVPKIPEEKPSKCIIF